MPKALASERCRRIWWFDVLEKNTTFDAIADRKTDSNSEKPNNSKEDE